MTARWDFAAYCACTWDRYSARCPHGYHRLLVARPDVATVDMPSVPGFIPRMWRRK